MSLGSRRLASKAVPFVSVSLRNAGPTTTARSSERDGRDTSAFEGASVAGALWYRMRPNGHDHDTSIIDIWSLGRFAPGKEPVVQQEIFHGFAAFRGQCEFLEEDFSNIEAVNRGVKSRGFRDAIFNPIQEAGIVHFHGMLEQFLRSAGS